MRPIDADTLKEQVDAIWADRPLSLLGARILVMIDNAPTIEPKRGEWIYTSNGYGYIGDPVEKCSVCGAEYEEAPFNYCPNCGADMREREVE